MIRPQTVLLCLFLDNFRTGFGHAPVTDENFIRHIHRALHHLYDPAELELNPLAGQLGIRRGDVPTALRKALLDGIAALKPGPRVPPDSNAWRVYQVLCYRFEEQSSQEEVATQMAVSPRQVRRLEHTAIHALANHLATRYGLAPQSPAAPVEGPGSEHDQELDFLRKSYPRETTSVPALVDSALKTVEGMLKSSQVELRSAIPAALPPVRGQATTLRQALLNLLLAAIHAGKGGVIDLSAGQDRKSVWIGLETAPNPSNQPGSDVRELLVLARRLAELSEGSLEQLSPLSSPELSLRLCLPVAEQVHVLFVDDNEDSLRLSERFLEGSRFIFHATRDPRQTLVLAEESAAQIIVLDIMLPGIDGWELLGRIRAHPRLGSVPVVISTILPHESLAASLGAAAFLRKPVTQEAILAVLNRLSGGED